MNKKILKQKLLNIKKQLDYIKRIKQKYNSNFNEISEKIEYIVETISSQLAKELSEWTSKTLRKKNIDVAVVSRLGKNNVREFDKTLMAHSGIVEWDEKRQQYFIYSLLTYKEGSDPRQHLNITDLYHFYLHQGIEDKDALILIPTKQIRNNLESIIEKGIYKKLRFTDKYNLLSKPFSKDSLNCIKWVVMALYSAKYKNYNPDSILKLMKKNYKLSYLPMSEIKKKLIRFLTKTVRMDEIKGINPVPAFSVISMYKSDLFEEKIFYKSRTII